MKKSSQNTFVNLKFLENWYAEEKVSARRRTTVRNKHRVDSHTHLELESRKFLLLLRLNLVVWVACSDQQADYPVSLRLGQKSSVEIMEWDYLSFVEIWPHNPTKLQPCPNLTRSKHLNKDMKNTVTGVQNRGHQQGVRGPYRVVRSTAGGRDIIVWSDTLKI